MILKTTAISISAFTGPLTPNFDDPIGALKACHVRIEQRLQMIERACEVFQNGDWKRKQEAAEALTPAVAYFTTGGVKHTEDEEVSLFPRMRPHLTSGDEAVAVMKSLESQHREGESFVEELKDIVERLTTPPFEFAEEDIQRLESVSRNMGRHYRPHTKLEDEFLFPRALDILSEEELTTIGQEMAQRRGVQIIK